jgi:Golgi nucleoside diphosphatase
MYNHHLKDNYLKNLNLMLMVSLLSKNHQYKIYNNNQQILTSVSQLNQMHNPNLKNNSLKIKKREGWILYLKYLF